jgi:hypothetical protein
MVLPEGSGDLSDAILTVTEGTKVLLASIVQGSPGVVTDCAGACF